MRGVKGLRGRGQEISLRSFRFTAACLAIVAFISLSRLSTYTFERRGNGHSRDAHSFVLPHLAKDSSVIQSHQNPGCDGPRGPVSHPDHHKTPFSHPRPAVGSYTKVNLDESKCMSYYQRYGLYTDQALGASYLDSYLDWLKQNHDGEVSYLERGNREAHELSRANFAAPDGSFPAWRKLMDNCSRKSSPMNAYRSAVILRAYENYTWSQDDILNVRAMIVEVSLNSAEPMDVRILLEAHDDKWAVAASERHRMQLLSQSVPREFWEMTEFWNEAQMVDLYPSLPGRFLNRMKAQSSYRSCFMPTQKFALEHPEYDFVWNWEMDTRFTGNFAELFRSSSSFARSESLDVDLRRYSRWFVPQVPHSEAEWDTAPSNASTASQEADLIVFNPIFDPQESGWYWENDIQNYPAGTKTSRRASLGRNVRFSRALLGAMSSLNAEEKKSTHCEAWPATVVLHSSDQDIWRDAKVYQAGSTPTLARDMKAVYVPHPVYFGHHHTPSELYARLSMQGFYQKVNEKFMRDSSFYYDGGHARRLYLEWKRLNDTCMASALLHPIKRMHLW